MKLKNFEISSEIELQTGNLFWDIHNFAAFVGLELIPASNAVVMKWAVPKEGNPWGCTENRFSGMTLYFDNLRLLTLTPRDIDMPLTEDSCVAGILKWTPTFSRMNCICELAPNGNLTTHFAWLFNFRVDVS